MYKKSITGILLLFSSALLLAQQKFTVNGTVTDKKNGESLIGTVVSVEEDISMAVETNEYGFYSLSLESGNYTLVVQLDGYEETIHKLSVNKDTMVNIALPQELVTQLENVVLTGEKDDKNVKDAQMGTIQLDVKEISKLPVLFGEKDVLKTIQLLPGVKTGGEGSTGFFVRGGSSDQNLILLDEAPVYNASHMLGFFSTFNSDALKDVTIIKGNTPAQYGGRLSSVLDVKMKEGNNQKYSVSGGLGLISSRLSIEGPIVKDKGSFMISGRRTYADLFLKLTEEYKDSKLYFYDFNVKANYKINAKNRVYLSGYFGRDIFGFSGFGIDWGNKTGTLRWNKIISPKLFSNTSLIYSDYNYKGSITAGESTLSIKSEIKDWTIKEELQYFLNSKNNIRFGLQSIYHNLIPNSFVVSGSSDKVKNSRKSWDNAFFVNNTMEAAKRLTLDYGLRFSIYSILGGDVYKKYDKGVLADSVVLASGKTGKIYHNLEPRFLFTLLLDVNSSIKGGYSRNTQHLHLLSNSTSGSPTDQWIGNSYNIKPEIADQISLGYFRNFKGHKYQCSIETYYKGLQNQVDYKNGADINSAPDVESQLLYGIGRAYGAEFLIKKTKGKFTGWIGYTLSKTERKIEGINDNSWYNAKQDRTHDLSIVAMYELSSRWSVSGLFVYNTGNAVTFPSGKYDVGGNTVFYYTGRNAYRMPAYHRMDFGATYIKQHKKKYESSWNFSLYNVYGRQNAYSITFANSSSDPTKTVATQTSLFRWVPSVTYNFKF